MSMNVTPQSADRFAVAGRWINFSPWLLHKTASSMPLLTGQLMTRPTGVAMLMGTDAMVREAVHRFRFSHPSQPHEMSPLSGVG